MKEPWRPVEDGHCERPGETTGVGTPSGAGEAPGMKGPHGEEEAWNDGTWAENPKIAQGRTLVKVQPSCNRDTRILEMTGPWENHRGQQQL